MIAVAILMMVVGALFLVPSAYAGPGNTCAVTEAMKESHNGTELYHHWKAEGVLPEAVQAVLIGQWGYHHVDGQSVKSWMKDNVGELTVAETTTFKDWGCENGHLINAGTRTIKAGEHVLGVVHAEATKREFSLKHCKGCKKKKVPASAVGKVPCSNPFGGPFMTWIWEKTEHRKPPRKHHRHHKKHHPKKKPVVCRQGEVMIGNGCSPQTNNLQNECEVKSGYYWNSDTLVCSPVQQNGVCSAQTGVVNGNGNNINQEVKCCTGTNSCNETINQPPPEEHPCGCEPKEPPKEPEEPEKPKKPEPPVVEWERIQELPIEHERNLCVTATPTSVVSAVQFAVVDGSRSNGGVGVYNASTNKYCVTYTAPSEEPSHVCVEEWIAANLPPGTKCDVAHVAVFTNNGSETVKGQMEIPITDPEKHEEVVW